MAGYTRATGDWVKDSQAEKEKKKKEAEERKRKQEQAKREQQQRIAAQSKTVKKYERATGDWEHDSAVVQSRLAPYSRANLSRQNARQQKTESYMDLTTANEPKARAGIEMYKARSDAQKYAEMNRVGYRNYDQDTVNRSVKGYEESYQRWKKVYDANKGPAAIDPKTSRQSEIRSSEAKIQRYTDTATRGDTGSGNRYEGVTGNLTRLGRMQRYLDTPGSGAGNQEAWQARRNAAETRREYQKELEAAKIQNEEKKQPEQSVYQRFAEAEASRRGAERSYSYWTQAAQDAAWFGDLDRMEQSLQHVDESRRKYAGATAQWLRAGDELSSAYQDEQRNLRNNDLAAYYAQNLSDEEIARRLEQERRPVSVTDEDRAENPGMYPDAAFRTMPRQASFDPTMTAGGEAPGNRFYMTEEEKQLTEQSDRYLLQQKVNDREVQIAALERAQQAHHERDLEQEVYGYALSGHLSDMAKQGQDALRQDMSNAQAQGSNPIDALAQSGSAEEALALFRGASAVATIWRNLMKCSDDQKERVYAMYSVNPQKAVELSQKYYDDAMDAYYAQFYNWANSKHGWQAGRRLAAGLLGTGAKLLSGFDPFGDAGQDLSRAGEAFIGGASESASRNGLFGIEVLGGDESPISGNVPYIGRGRAGEAVQLGTSILESSAIAVPAMLIGRYDVAASKVAGLLGTTLMGSSAAADDYRESIRNGLTESQAIAHATAAGIAEAAFEYISLDRLIDPGNIKKGLIRWLTQGGIEASEEVCTTIANRISDEVIANFSGIRNSIEREALEYQIHGYSAEEAEAKAQIQWLSGLLMDGLGGFMSGLIMGGGSEAIQSATGKIANTMAEDIKDYRSGSLLGLESAGYTNTDTMSALSSYAEANNIDVRGLTDVQAKALERSQEQTETTVPVQEQTQTETAKVNQEQAPTEQAAETAETEETPQFSRRELRKAGKVRSQIVDSITQKFEGQTAAEKAAQYDSLVEQYGSGIEAVATEALYNAARQDMRTVTDVTTLEQRHGTDAAAFTSETARQTMERAYRDTQQIIMRDTGDTTRTSMDSLAALNRNLRKTDGATLNLQAEVTGEDGGPKTVSVRSFDNEGKRVVLEDGSKVDVKDLTTDADTKSFLQAMQEAELGEYTNEAFQTFLNTGTEQTLADGIEWITGYRGAFGVGEVRGNITNAIRLAARYGLDTDTAAAAYYQGVKASDALVAQSKQTLANAQEMAKGQKQTVTGRRSNIDVSAIEGVNMTMEERRQFNFANKIFSMIGVELRWVASDEKNGRFVGANGSYLHGVVTLDIHAGRNFLRDVNSGILATTGHELTHFLQEYAPEQYRALKEFLFQQIIQGSANGEARLERLIWEKQRRASSKLSRRAAEDEVVADACQTMLRDSKAIREFAQQDEEAAKGIARWLDKWFGKLKRAFSRSAQLTEEARFVDGFAEEVREAFGKLWDDALREAVETHDRVGNIEKTQQQNSDRKDVVFANRGKNEANEDIRYSERDYSTPSDAELVMGMDEKDADTPDGKALIREVQAKQKQIEALTEKLAEAKRQLTTTKRALNTKGIGNVAGNVIRDFGISDAKGKNIKQQATGILTEAYQKALDQIDSGATAAEAWETVYNAAVEAAELLIDQGRYTENNNGKWTNVPYSRYIGENRQMVIEQMVSEAAVDFSRNRYRGPIQETAADRLVARTEKRMQGKLDETKAKNAELKAENERLEQDITFLKDQADGARFAAGNLYDQVKDLRQELKDNRKLTAQERKTVQKKIDGLNRQIETKKAEAAAWRDRANRNASLLKSALESKSRDIQTVKDESQRQVDKAVAEKEAAVRKLEDQIEREKKILSGELRAPGLVKLLKAERERAETRVREQKESQFARYKEGKKAGELRSRIKNLSDEMKRRMTRPTDGAYVPASLYGSMTKLADVLDTVLAPNPGTKAETRYRSMMDAIHSLANEYDGIKDLDDYAYSSEFDQEIRDQISELERVLNKDRSWTDELTGDGKRVGDLSLTELQQTYDILRQINQTMKNAAKLMNNQKLGSLYDAMRNVADQQAGMRSRNASNAFTRGMRNWRLDTMSTMRAVEKMSGWDRNAALYQLMQGIEQGVVDSDTWMMQYNKRMETLKTGKNELEYRRALSKKLDYGVKDTKDGIPVMMTKMQALQILMTAEREASNDKLVHLQKGGAEIRDAVKIQEGKAAKATSYHIDVTPELIQKIRDSLTEWDKQYMQTVHDYFKTESREMNKILYSLKNRVLETEEAYVPYIVDSNYLETKLTEQQAMNMWVKTPGSTNALKTKASQPVIIDGMDTVMAKHVRESADYIGLALPIRDFSKVYNGMLSQGEGEIALPVKKTIADNWGDKGAKLLTDAVLDVQGSSRVGSYNTAFAAHLNKLQSGFVKSALLINPSVTIKQAASYIAAESVLSHRALIAGNRPLFTGQDASHSPSLIAQIFAAPSGSTATRIYNEIDEHTSMHYVRRQGMSYTELANEANRQGWLKRNTGMMGAKMEQNAAGHFVRKAGQVLNPVQWIQRMDVATTAALWVACKEQAKMDGMTAGTDEFWQHTTELYEQALRETQPMYDNLHRTNMQKEKTGLMQFLFPFRTVPVQNHGQIAASFDAMLAAKGKGKEVQGEAVKHFIKTVWAQTESAVVFSVMTFLAAGLKRKTKNYRDEDDEISPESILKGILNDAGGVWLSNIMPMTGSELWSWGSKAINSLKGVPNGYTFDTFSVGVVDMLNDLSDAADRMFKAIGKAARGEISFKEFSETGDDFLATFAKLAGIPATTIKTYAEGLWGDVQDIREGRIPAFNDEAVERKNSTNARRFTKAWNAKDEAKMDAVLEEMFGSMVRTSDAAQSARNALSAAAKEAYQTGKMDLEEYVEYLEKTEAFTSKGITTRVSTMLKEDFIAGKRTAEETVELLVKYKDYKGNPEQKAWAAVKEWAAKAEHDDEDDYDWNQYDELKAAIAAGEGVQDEIQELKDHGYTQKQINDALKKSIQEAFTAGNYTEGEAIDALVRYGVTYSQNGKAVAYDQDKGWQTVREWAAKAGHEDDEDFSYSLYDNLRSAVAAGKGIDAAMKELTDHGVKEADVNDELNKTVMKLYTDGAITEKTAIGLLTKYHTVTKDKKTRPQTADEAWAALQKASAEAAHADEEDYSYSKYDDIDEALDKNADISKLVKQLTDHGEKQANITNHVKGYLIDRYVAGKTSESALKNQLSRYCGITKTDEVAGILKDANCEKDCGYGFGEIKNAYGRGDLSEATAKKMLRKYGGLTDSGAEHRIGFWDYCRKNPDTSISAQGWDSYYEKTLPNIGGTLSGRGMKQSSFTEYLEKRAQLEITDLDGDGKKDNKEYIVNLIASLNLSSAEKDMLYYYNNYGARDLWKTPWH